jgi:uncharacterized protein
VPVRSRVLGEGTERSFELIFDPGDEALDGLADFARREGVRDASFTAIGGFEHASLGFFNEQTQGFDPIHAEDEQVEVLSFLGQITRDHDEPHVHAHVVLGRRDGTTRGGHLLRGVVRPILIVTLDEAPHALHSHHHHPH